MRKQITVVGMGCVAALALVLVTLHAAASYPGSVKTFTTRVSGDTIQPAHINDLQDEVTAIEQALLTVGTAHHVFPSTNNARDLGTTALRWRDVYIANALQGPMSVNGTTTFNGQITLASAEVQSAIVSPPQITANTNDYGPTGLSTARILRLATDASRNLTGIVAQANGFRLLLRNGGAFDLVLAHESASSTAANRFACPGGANFTLNTSDQVEIWYDGAISRWAVVGF